MLLRLAGYEPSPSVCRLDGSDVVRIHCDPVTLEATNTAVDQLNDCSSAVDLEDLSFESDEVTRAGLAGEPNRLPYIESAELLLLHVLLLLANSLANLAELGIELAANQFGFELFQVWVIHNTNILYYSVTNGNPFGTIVVLNPAFVWRNALITIARKCDISIARVRLNSTDMAYSSPFPIWKVARYTGDPSLSISMIN